MQQPAVCLQACSALRCACQLGNTWHTDGYWLRSTLSIYHSKGNLRTSLPLYLNFRGGINCFWGIRRGKWESRRLFFGKLWRRVWGICGALWLLILLGLGSCIFNDSEGRDCEVQWCYSKRGLWVASGMYLAYLQLGTLEIDEEKKAGRCERRNLKVCIITLLNSLFCILDTLLRLITDYLWYNKGTWWLIIAPGKKVLILQINRMAFTIFSS